MRKESLLNACLSKNFCIGISRDVDRNPIPKLKNKHDYYYQIQGQMALVGVDWCDLVIWTPTFLHIERVYFDNLFWKKECLPHFLSFYIHVMAPELIYPRHTLALDVIDYIKV